MGSKHIFRVSQLIYENGSNDISFFYQMSKHYKTLYKDV